MLSGFKTSVLILMSAQFSIAYLIGDDESILEDKEIKLKRKRKTRRQTPTISKIEKDLPDGLKNVRVRLEGASLWRRFHALDTEMIVTKSGRRMFPTLQFTVTDLNPNAYYSIMVDFGCVDRKRYRYSFYQSKWTVAGPGDVELPCRMHMHSDSPALGSHWMKQVIAFERIKLTNNQLDQNGYIIVNSMHRYQPRLHIVMHEDGESPSNSSNSLNPPNSSKVSQRTFNFWETQFMAVTAYQNHRITELKIERNPFAKGFRECELDELSLLASSAQLQYSQLYPLIFGKLPSGSA